LADSVANLASVWASIDDLCSGLSDADWARPTGCPGWSVKDHLSHIIDFESRALGRDAPAHEPPEFPYLRNDLGRINEIGVDARRVRSGPQVLAEFREVTRDRLAQLRTLTDADLAAPTMTPAGPGTVADLLNLRVMDSWSHEQDIRRATGRPGHTQGPAVDQATAHFISFLPYVVGKRAAAPEGSAVEFRIGGLKPVIVEVVAGRGRFAADPVEPTAVVTLPAATFGALVCGRSDAPDDAQVSGDETLGQKVLGGLGLMP
jgi:uncharacterized protein (TIGR03083 family)